MLLTIREIENAKPAGKPYKMTDGGGLCLLIYPSGAKLWLRGSQTLDAGIDPMAERKAKNSFENIGRKWWAWWSVGKSPRHVDTVMRRLEADAFPVNWPQIHRRYHRR